MSELPSCAVVSWQISIIVKATEVLTTATKTTINLRLSSEKALQPHSERERGRTEIWRSHFDTLLKSAMCLRDRLICEGPILQALRPGEVSALTVEGHDFDTGHLTFMDSKDFKTYTRPMDPVYAEHAEAYMIQENITVGIFLRPLPTAHHTGRKPGSKTRGVGLSCSMIERRFKLCCRNAGIPEVAPRVGRAVWACKEHYVLHKALGFIKWFMRHDSLQSTEHYLFNDIIDCEFMEQLFYEGRDSPLKTSCALFEDCPRSKPGCDCRLFQPKPLKWIEVKTP